MNVSHPCPTARLTFLGGLPLVEATEGMELRPGHAVIAPGGQHLRFRQSSGRFYAQLSRLPEDAPHDPSIDVLFRSVAEAAGDGALAVVLTGMGDDGTRGARAIREAGGRVFAESASSCVVYGMPRSVIEAGLANGQAALDDMAEAMVTEVARRAPH